MIDLDPAPRALAFRLLGIDLNRYPPCCGYSNCCGCEDCVSRSENVSSAFREWVANEHDSGTVPRLRNRASPVAQPWEATRRAA